MAKDYNATVASCYWVSITCFYKKGHYIDYIHNPDKRIQTGTAAVLGDKFWKDYVVAYRNLCTSGKLIIRAKVITDDSVKIHQIYEVKKDRVDFLNAINSHKFHNDVSINVTEEEYEITPFEKDDLITKIISSDRVIIQWCREDHQRSKMILGDPLKGDKLIVVS